MMIENLKDTSLVNSYAVQLDSALTELGYSELEDEIEQIAIFLVRTMGSELRNYHKPIHSLEVSTAQPPIAKVASLFHDIVYLQVDPQWLLFLSSILYPMIPSESFSLNVKDALIHTDNPWFQITAVVFGFENIKDLQPLGGLNEFLSALVAINKLEKILNPKDLIKVISCIEATIPFRKTDLLGNTPSRRLEERLMKASSEFQLDLSEFDISKTIIDCRSIVENDLFGFRSEQLSLFLSDSWNVLSENYQALRNSFFLVSDYRRAVYGLINFFQMLDPENMYWSDDISYNENSRYYKERARYNLKNGTEYMKAFFLSLTLIEAIAKETGGDAPYEYFVGAKRTSREHNPPEISHFLNLESVPIFDSEEEEDVYNVLLNGRQIRAEFDRKYCPLGAYLYYQLNTKKIFDELFNFAVMFSQNDLKGLDFINKFPQEQLIEIIPAISNLALRRKNKILNLLS